VGEKKTRVLIVDDDKAIRKLLERIAKRAGFDVDSAKDGIEALEMLDRREYDIAIVDLMMPRLSGYELVQKLSTRTPRPIVLVATALTNGDVASLDDSMVRRVIRKPFDVQAVSEALVETARHAAERRAAAEAAIPIAPPEAATIPVAEEPKTEADGPSVAAAEEPKADSKRDKPKEKNGPGISH
jgi:DNA-binding response OmpR family regulator